MPFGNPLSVTVRSSLLITGTGSTESTAVTNFGSPGLRLFVDQSAVAQTSAGGGTGVLTLTVQEQDPVSTNWASSTGTIVCTTALQTFVGYLYPGGGINQVLGRTWRVSVAGNSSATNWTYSVGAQYLPTRSDTG